MILIALIVAAFLLGAPLYMVFAAVAMAGWYWEEVSISVVGTDIFRLSSNPVFVTIPLFTYAGYLLGESNAPQRLLGLARALFGTVPGGLAIVAIVASSLFTAFTGASGVTIAALGALLYPALLKDGYSEGYSLGLVTTGGSLGLLFAPSVPIIVYAIVTEVPVVDMFIAGLLPGLMMVLLLSAFSMYVAWKEGVRRVPFTWKGLYKALWEARWEAPLPVFVLLGIYGGFFTVSEIAAITALWAFVVEVLILREISWKGHRRIVRESMVMAGGVLIIVATAMAATNYFIDIDLPSTIFEAIEGLVDGKLSFLILLNLFLFVLGMFLDIFSALVIVVPLILPVAKGYGVDLVHLGVIFLANMQIGYLTPPFGMGLFISSYRFSRDLISVAKASLPFMAILLLALLAITYWDDLSLFLLKRMGRPY